MADQNAEPGGWWINVESKPGLTSSSDVLKTFSTALKADKTLHSATATLDPTAGVLRASMTIAEPRRGHAIELATAAFYRGLDAAGFRTDVPGWELLIEVGRPLPAE